MNYLSISTIIKNEEDYLYEWVRFHYNQGVDHFYLYDNSDGQKGRNAHKEAVGEFSEYITWHELPGHAKQRESCNHTILSYWDASEWMIFCDVDEFFYSGKDPRFVDTLRRDYDREGISAIAVHWLLFGSNGHAKKTNEPVLERFVRRAEGTNPHVKSVVRMRDAYSMGSNVHTFRVRGMIVDENFACQSDEYAVVSPATADVLRCNHYVTKSKEECDRRRSMPRCDTGEMRSSDFFIAHDCNDVVDKRILEVV